MQSPEGGYYSSYDADSEGHEGKFYVWDREEAVRQALTTAEYGAFAAPFRTRPRRPTSKVAGTCTFSEVDEDVAKRLATDNRRNRVRCSNPRAGSCWRSATCPRLARPRRQDPDLVERPDDPRNGHRRAGIGSRRPG